MTHLDGMICYTTSSQKYLENNMKRILEKIDKFIHKILENEKDKWESGMKNSYFLTYDLVDDIEQVLDKWDKKYEK